MSYDNKTLKTIGIIFLTSSATSALVLSGFILGNINNANNGIYTTENSLWASLTGVRYFGAAFAGAVRVCSSKFNVDEINEETSLENHSSYSIGNKQSTQNWLNL